MRLLGIAIDNLPRQAISEKIGLFLEEPAFHRIATINPEFLLLAEKNPEFRRALEEADLKIADGVGISLAFFLRGAKLKYRFAGADLMAEILKTAEQKNLSVFLAVRKDGLSSYQEIRSALLKKYPRLRVDGREFEEFIPNSQFLIHNSIVFSNFGIPFQETFLSEMKKLPQYSGIRLAMGVGGSFDYLTGKLPRAPKIMRIFGLEWLWRFFLQPIKRSRRIWNAVIVFPFKVLLEKI